MNARRVLAVILTIGLTTALPAPASRGMFIRPQLEEVPIAKVIDNLDKAAAKDPKDVKVRYNLARAFSMAWAEKVDTVKVWKNKDLDGIWFGFTPKHVPYTPKKTDDEAKQKLAKEYLDKAITTYRNVIELDPKNLPAKLGLAWCLEQAAKKDEAIKAYRDTVEEAWEKESSLKSLGLAGTSVTLEAAGYLVPLLDKEKDKKEIATLEDRVAKLRKLPRMMTPIVVPLRDGLTAKDMIDSKARVRFDADGSGLREEWNWFTRDAGILVFDPHKRRNITSALQWFGNVTFWMAWDNGYEALKSLDDNSDGVLSGQELEGLAIWIDANGDGICQPHEVKTLAELGIVAISCRWEIDSAHPDRIAFSRAGVTFQGGATRSTYDVILKKW
jgi:hypothetical protein